MVKKVLVTGGAGYIGSYITFMLKQRGIKSVILDKGLWGWDAVLNTYKDTHKLIHISPGDVRNIDDVKQAIKDCDAVIHLASIVGDPACASQLDESYETNYISTARIAGLAKEMGIKKFIFASTCSVYGAMSGMLTEDAKDLNPQSWYAKTKILSERALLSLQDDDFKPTILRLGTVYGLSQRPRFDLVVNFLTGKLTLEEPVRIFGGKQYRPFIEVRDVGEAFIHALMTKECEGEIFNVCRDNFQIKDLGEILQEEFPKGKIEYVDDMQDPRTYMVSKLKLTETGYNPTHELRAGIRQMRDFVKNKKIDIYEPKYHNHPPKR